MKHNVRKCLAHQIDTIMHISCKHTYFKLLFVFSCSCTQGMAHTYDYIIYLIYHQVSNITLKNLFEFEFKNEINSHSVKKDPPWIWSLAATHVTSALSALCSLPVWVKLAGRVTVLGFERLSFPLLSRNFLAFCSCKKHKNRMHAKLMLLLILTSIKLTNGQV